MNNNIQDQDSLNTDRAESKVNNSMDRFESAIENLADKVEDTSQRVHHVMDLAQRQKEELVNLKLRVQEAYAPIKPYVTRVQQNPRPLLLGLAGVLAGIVALSFLQKRRTSTGVQFADDVTIPETAPGELTY